jgi:hypothetical protein
MSLIQPRLSKVNADEESLVCFVKSREQQQSLILSIWSAEKWVMPWAQIVKTKVEEKKIELTYGNCRVVVTGENLLSLLDDIASYRLVALREFPAESRPIPADKEPFVSRIELLPLANAPARDTPA